MNHLQRHQFSSLCEALYRKDNEPMDHEKVASIATASSQGEKQGEPAVTIPAHAMRTAIRQAEQAVDDIMARLRDAESERAELARKLGVQQEMIDRLESERDYRTRHVRTLAAAQRV